MEIDSPNEIEPVTKQILVKQLTQLEQLNIANAELRRKYADEPAK